MSTLLHLATPVISNDEPCFMLVEEHIQAPNASGFRRYQIITVVRNDELVEWHHDMGPAKKFKNIDMFRIPGGVRDPETQRLYIEHTVGELRDIADTLRSRPQMRASLPRTDLIALYQRYMEQQAELAKRRMVFGNYQTRSLTRNVKEKQSNANSN